MQRSIESINPRREAVELVLEGATPAVRLLVVQNERILEQLGDILAGVTAVMEHADVLLDGKVEPALAPVAKKSRKKVVLNGPKMSAERRMIIAAMPLGQEMHLSAITSSIFGGPCTDVAYKNFSQVVANMARKGLLEKTPKRDGMYTRVKNF